MKLAQDDGFSLIEVIVAFAILSAAIILTYTVVGGALKWAATSEREARLMEEAYEKLTAIAAQQHLSPGSDSHTANGIAWHSDIAELPLEGGANYQQKLFSIKVTAAYEGDDKLHKSLQTIVMKMPE